MNKKLLFIGFPTYDNNHKFYGGTEVVNHVILSNLYNKYDIQYVVTRRVSNELIKSYEKEYHCKVFKTSNYSMVDYINFSPDFVFISMCTNTKDPIFNIINHINDVPVWVYTHMSTPDLLNGYDFTKNNFYYSYLSDTAMKVLGSKIPLDRLFRMRNPVYGISGNEELITSPRYDILVNSRVTRQKGIENTINLCNDLGWNSRIVGHCQNKSYLSEILSFSDKCEYLGVVSRELVINNLLNSKFLCFLPNGPEGLNLSVIESQSLGTPVITWKEFSDYVSPKYNILLSSRKNYIEEFKTVYLHNLDRYLSVKSRNEMRNEVINKYGTNNYISFILSKINQIGGFCCE